MLWAFGCPEALSADEYTHGKGRAGSSHGAGLAFMRGDVSRDFSLPSGAAF